MARRHLRIAADGRELLGRPTGVGRYLRGILDAWAAADFPHDLTLYGPGPAPRDLPSPGGRVRWQALGNGRAGTWWEQTSLARAVRRSGADVFFGVGYSAPLWLRCPSIVVVHDASFFAHPEWFPRRQGWRRRRITRGAARRAHAVVTVSEFSASEITRYLGIPRTSIHLAPPGAPAVEAGPPFAERESLVLFAGSLFNRRHIPLLIDAFAEAAREVPDARLVLAGDNRTSPRQDPVELAAAAGLAGRVDWLEYVSDDALAALYRRARVFALLSGYEGFAMTPLEAIAHGVPPVLLDTAVSREIYGAGAALVAADRASVGRALVWLLRDGDAHAALLAAGRAQLTRYSWHESAVRIQRALEHAARTGRS